MRGKSVLCADKRGTFGKGEAFPRMRNWREIVTKNLMWMQQLDSASGKLIQEAPATTFSTLPSLLVCSSSSPLQGRHSECIISAIFCNRRFSSLLVELHNYFYFYLYL